MKKLMLICALGTFGFASVNAATVPVLNSTEIYQETTRVAPENLPQPVKDAIDNDMEDKDARIVSANQRTKDGQMMYEVTFQKEDKTWTKKYDAQGNKVDDDK
ncbi:hypothetical protein KIH41_17450 [Litoribacter ruber]|uniref:hypothetical protein n=1 Tax=Litoribacter ruber TaxID=702568 RepID=UPI001BDAB8B5|nr:hypothetical protein [Litoribacter ruber]MBT0813078.1 hypothetical protein [Litoribacter ruber]